MNKKTDLSGYTLSIQGRHIEVTEPIRDYILEKLAKIERFSPHLINAHVTLEVQKLQHKVDIDLRFDHFKVKVHGVSENLYASIDQAMDRLQARVRKYKERVREHQARGAHISELDVHVYKSDEELWSDEIERANADTERERFRMHSIIRQEKKPLKTLTAEEAMLKMELSKDAFMLYRGEEDRKLKVIYRMRDGNFGVIAAE